MNEKEIKLKHKLEKEIEDLRHNNKIEELELEKKLKLVAENIKFDHQCQLQRIRSAEIQRSQSRNKHY